MSTSSITFDELRDQSGLVTMAAFNKQGYQSARLVGRYLQQRRAGQLDGPYPRWFLIDLGYALQIREWERQGLLSHVPTKLPASAFVIQEIIAKLRFAAENLAEELMPNEELARRVTTAYLLYFNHTSTSKLLGDFVVKLNNVDDQIEALAQWLWQHRSVLNQEEGDLPCIDRPQAK